MFLDMTLDSAVVVTIEVKLIWRQKCSAIVNLATICAAAVDSLCLVVADLVCKGQSIKYVTLQGGGSKKV